MANHQVEGVDSLVMDSKDHVATALKEIQVGQVVTYRIENEIKQIQVRDLVPFGHKIAITEIAIGEHVRKYGETIGSATAIIHAGQHVHVHNIEGIRGRGDKSKGGNA